VDEARKSTVLDEYECVAWQPELPKNESPETQEYKRTWLCTNYAGNKGACDKVAEFMDSTLPPNGKI